MFGKVSWHDALKPVSALSFYRHLISFIPDIHACMYTCHINSVHLRHQDEDTRDFQLRYKWRKVTVDTHWISVLNRELNSNTNPVLRSLFCQLASEMISTKGKQKGSLYVHELFQLRVIVYKPFSSGHSSQNDPSSTKTCASIVGGRLIIRSFLVFGLQ